MLYINGKEITVIEHLKKGVAYVYHLGKLVWQGVRSCYSSGQWRNDLPWTQDDAWNNG